jgi:hypothetical protein
MHDDPQEVLMAIEAAIIRPPRDLRIHDALDRRDILGCRGAATFQEASDTAHAIAL